MKRGYLNRDESNQFMVLMSAIQLIQGERSLENKKQDPMWEEWSKHDMINVEQQKNLKMATTYLKKFITSKLQDLDKETQDKINKKIQKFDFKLVDDYTLQKLFRDMNDRMKYVTLPREDFYNWTEEVMYKHCTECTKDRGECNLYKILDDNLIPEAGYNIPSCPYAYKLPEKKVELR